MIADHRLGHLVEVERAYARLGGDADFLQGDADYAPGGLHGVELSRRLGDDLAFSENHCVVVLWFVDRQKMRKAGANTPAFD